MVDENYKALISKIEQIVHKFGIIHYSYEIEIRGMNELLNENKIVRGRNERSTL